jgi:tRNA(Ile)-lysidine synthase
LLHQLRHQLGIKLHIAHFNHRLRLNADQDERFVRNLASKLNVPISFGRRSNFSKVKVSEDTARQWRFRFFTKIVYQVSAQAIALAHNQNDLAETVFMRLLRGSGLLGLRGILSETTLGQTKLIRPLLSVQRSRIEEYLRQHHLNYRNDETNRQTHYLRNKIRLKLLPDLVKNYNVNFSHTLVDLAYTTQADYDYLLNQARHIFRKNAIISNIKVRIKIKFFLKQHISMRRMMLRLSFEQLASSYGQLNFSHIEEVEDLLLNRPAGARVHWPQSVSVFNSKDELVLTVAKQR